MSIISKEGVVLSVTLLLSAFNMSVISVTTNPPEPTYIVEERQGSDQTGQVCPDKQFRCPEGYCIPDSWVCDHVFDCQHGEDEQNCPWSRTTQKNSFVEQPAHVTFNSTLNSSTTVRSTSDSTQTLLTTSSSTQTISTPNLARTNLSSAPSSSTQTVITVPISSTLGSAQTVSTVPSSTQTLPIPTPSSTQTVSITPASSSSTIPAVSTLGSVQTASTVPSSMITLPIAVGSPPTSSSSSTIFMLSSNTSQASSTSQSSAGIATLTGNNTVSRASSSTLYSLLTTTDSQPTADTRHGTTIGGGGVMVRNSTTPASICSSGLFRCNVSNSCISYAKVCDGVIDCSDYSDESSCSCSSRYGFRCKMGVCVNTGAWCNGIDDCPDSSDEPLNCFQLCAPNLYQCANGKCVSQSDVCDGYNTCLDYSDERNCDCEDFEFRCHVMGLCMDIARWCNGYIDCPDESDEPANCSSNCPANWVRCDGTRCLSSVYVCDGVFNCLDRSDEQSCGDVSASLSFSFRSDVVLAKCNNSVAEFLICMVGWNGVLSDLVCQRSGCNSSTVTYGEHQTNRNRNFLVSQSPDSLFLQPGPCPSNEALKLECSCRTSSNSECFASPSLSWSTLLPQASMEWPWQASIFNQYGYVCSGVILNNHWILTAAHCFSNTNTRVSNDDVVVQVGTMHLWTIQQQQQQQQQQHSLLTARDIVLHPQFNSSSKMFDVALVRLSFPISFMSTVQSVCITASETSTVNVDSICVMTSLGQSQSSVNLISSYVKLITDEMCKNMTSALFNYSSSCSCALTVQLNNQDNCKQMGDDASPLVCQSVNGGWNLYGLSTPIMTSVESSTFIFQRVTQLISWIQQTMSISMLGSF